MKIDLHMHSTASDGKLSPEELVDWAIEKGMKGFAITDHEVVGGSRRAIEYAEGKEIEVVSGIEIGADDEELGVYDVHIVGLFLDLENKGLLDLSEKLMKAREVQKRGMIVKLNDLGYEISFEELMREVDGVNYGRPHIAQILMRRYSEFKSISDVFDKLLGYTGSANVVQRKEGIAKTIEVIHSAGGVAILAHPMFREDYESVIDKFVDLGGDGIEVDYFYGNRKTGENVGLELVERVRRIAEKKGLIISGGGDFHRSSDPHEIGDYGVSEKECDMLKKYWSEKWKKN